MSGMRFHANPYLLLTLANLFWAGNWVVGRAFRDEVPPFALSFWRWTIALLLLLPFAWPHLRRDRPALIAAWPWLLLCGTLGTGGYNALAYMGLQYTTAINGLLLNSFVPIMIVSLSWLLLGRRLGGKEALGILVSFTGVIAIVARGEPSTLLALALNVGDIWVLASVLVWAIYTLLLPHRPTVHPYSFLLVITIVGLIALAPFYAWEIHSGRHVTLSPASVSGIIYTGVFPAFLGYIFWNRGVAEVGPARAGLFMHLIPAFGIVLSVAFLSEQPRLYHLAGIGLIFSGIWLNTRPSIPVSLPNRP
jgi:drug/metabolite transporter (DMT)-like permease